MGQEENRRAEITSSDERITGPIRRDEIEYNASLRALNFKPDIDAPNGIKQWSLDVMQGSTSRFSQSGQQQAPPKTMTWPIDGDVFQRDNDSLVATLRVIDGKNQQKTVTQKVAVNTLTLERKREERIGGYIVNRSKLILFDYDKATVSKMNRTIIDEVSKSITPNSKVSIIGYTDALGDPEYNVKLSEQRAESVKNAFGKVLKDVQVTTKGVGSTQLLFPNDTPEGRFYCRMVQVIIETPETE
jgi:outer membrane protein OmpA-like peptidoglycan-associated protein